MFWYDIDMSENHVRKMLILSSQFREDEPSVLICPECGRISRRLILPSSGSSYQLAEAFECPFCGSFYHEAEEGDDSKYKEAYERYTRAPGAYNASAKRQYALRTEEENNGFLSAADEKISRWKKELLDTGMRNRLVNFRETRSGSLKVLEPSAKELFSQLAVKEKELSFRRPVTKLSDYRTYAVLALMDTLGCPLPVEVGDIGTSGTVSEREKTLKNLQAKTRLAGEEQGINILYIAFGFVLWRDHTKANGRWIKSPLLMMPAALSRGKLTDPFKVRKTDDEVTVNPTLSYLFDTEYGITLPPFVMNGKDAYPTYLNEVQQLIDDRGWKVIDEAYLGLFSFLKISMYHDLEENADRIKNHPVLRAMCGDRSGLVPVTREMTEYDIDASQPSEWHEVVDADSSQEEAVMLFRKGVSFVMQGPPGTGKSQTITNIIAEALAEGKKILFVSEKAAALEVVYKRLSENGLSDFCLSLHDYRADKKRTVAEIEKNLRLRPETAGSYIYRDLKDLFTQRTVLKTYAEELHAVREPLQESIYSIFGRLSALEKNTSVPFRMENIEDISADAFAECLMAAEGYENALRRLGGRLTENPWFNTSLRTSSQTVREEMKREWGGLPEDLKELHEKVSSFGNRYGLSFSHTAGSLEKELSEAMTVLSLPVYPAMNRRQLNTLIKKADELGERQSRLLQGEQRLTDALRGIRENWQTEKLKLDEKQLNSLRHTIEDEEHPVHTMTDLKKEEERLHRIQKQLKTLSDTYDDAADLLKCPAEGTGRDLLRMAQLLKLLSASVIPEENWFHPVHSEEALKLADETDEQVLKIRQMENSLNSGWDPEVLKINAEGMLGRFRSEYTGMFYMLKSNYRADMKQLRMYCRNTGSPLSDSEAMRVLQFIHEINLEKMWFEDNRARLRTSFGRYEDGMKTDTSKVREGIETARKIAGLFSPDAVPYEMIQSLSSLDDSVTDAVRLRNYASILKEESVSELFAGISSLCEREPETLNIRQEMFPLVNSERERLILSRGALQTVRRAVITEGSLYEKIRELISDADTIVSELKEAGCIIPDKISSLPEEAEECAAEYRKELETLDPAEHTEYAFLFTEEQPSWQYLLHTLKKIRFYEQSSLPGIYGQLRSEMPEKGKFILGELNDLIRLHSRIIPQLQAFHEAFGEKDVFHEDILSLSHQADACLNDFDALDRWIDTAEAEEECRRLGMESFTEEIRKKDNTVSDVRAAFEKGFALQWLTSVCKDVPAVRDFRRRVFDQKTEKFRKLDTKQLLHSRTRIREKVISSFPDRNNVTSEMAVLTHEAEKKRRIMPLRRLFREIPHLLLQLKPCLMMSPLSAAYFLNADDYHFDLVIFDEASQIFPQDAVGAILRGDQVIIAGDPKQLPPTDFFIRNSQPEEFDDENDYEETYDSILEEASAVLPGKMLLWHYRSRSEELISFSNRQIYHNELITFPSLRQAAPDTGVEFVHVEDGYYEAGGRSRNVPEARKCAELLQEHIRKYPERSLGIIAFSEKQQQAISREVQRFRENNPDTEWFFDENREGAFFVKNLETVQGDERDTIFFSVGYAKTKEQKKNNRPMTMQFGPLSRSGGERRLNVAVTRARINVKLVSSVMPSDLKDDVSSEGVRMLKEYMLYALGHGNASENAESPRGKDEFADSICRYLNEKGYETVRNAGTSGYRIDIAVKHPVLENVFAAGIECDGNNYISAVTVRERDRLRSSVLQGMGWHMYRVWSAEWFRNRDGEGKQLTDFIDRAAEEMTKKETERKGEEHGGSDNS